MDFRGRPGAPRPGFSRGARRSRREGHGSMRTLDTTLPLLDDPRAPTAKDDRPGCGCLMVEREGRRLSLPLRSVSFGARVAERIAEVTVEQVFENPHAELLE